MLDAQTAGLTEHPHGADGTMRMERCTNQGSELHEGLIEVGSPAFRDPLRYLMPEKAVGSGNPDSMYSGNDSPDVTVDGSLRLIKCNGTDGCGRIRAYPGKFENLLDFMGEYSMMFFQDQSCRPVQVAGSSVVPEPGPKRHYFPLRSVGDRFDVGESIDEAIVEIKHRGNLSLLKHDLGNPDSIRSWIVSPWQISFMPGIPTKEIFPEF